jgi:predicted transposase/invertase (TIGR01784 family)
LDIKKHKEKWPFKKLKRTICINFLEFTLFPGDNEFWNRYHVANDRTGKLLTNSLELHFFEIGKMKVPDEEDLITVWIEFLKNPNSEVVAKVAEVDAVIKETVDMYKEIIADKDTQDLYRGPQRLRAIK